MCALISNTQTEQRFYEKFLFDEKPTENRWVWKNLIDTTNDNLYTDLTVEVDREPKLKERLVSIRRRNEQSLPQRYLESQNVFGSSLSQDVTRIDLSFSSVRTSTADAQAAIQRQTNDTSKYILEKNSINDHEVMATLCAVIEHMFESEITPIDRRVAPEWLESICVTLEDDTVHKNIRLFLAALIDNCRHQFRHYAKRLTRALMKLLISDAFNQNIDAFVTFLVADLLEWHQTYKIETDVEFNMASSLVAQLMRHAWHERKAVFKKNLELIKCLVEIWKDHLLVPRQFLLDSLRHSQDIRDRNQNVCGIQLNAIFLVNELIPWTNDTQIEYLRALGMCLDNDNTIVYLPAAQGMFIFS